MPPKKAPPKGAKEEPAEPDDGAERELVEKELVIGYLKSKLGRYQEHGDHLQVENIKLSEDLETQKLNLRDINEFLTNELKARSLTTSALEAKVFDLNNAVEELKKGHEIALNRLRADKDKEADVLRNSLTDYERKGKATQEFLDRKEAMEAELAGLKAELAAKIKDYEYRLTDLDRSHIQDREKWKRETMQKIKETKIQMMKLTDNQLEMTTKRTIMENEQMSIELHYQSRQTEKLMNKNMVLLEENQDLRQQLSLSKQTQEELARRNNVYQKTIKSLLSKLKEQGDVQEANEPLLKALDERIGDLELNLHLAKLTAQEEAHQLQVVQQRLTAARAVNEAAVASHDTTVRFLTTCLEDVRTKIVTVVREEDEEEDPAEDPLQQQEGQYDGGDHAGAGAAQRALSGRSAFTVGGESTVQWGANSSRSLATTVAGGDPSFGPRYAAVFGAGAVSGRTAATDSFGPAAHRAAASGRSPAGGVVPELRLGGGTTVEMGRLEELDGEQRERVLSYLLEKMHVFMHQQALAATEAEEKAVAAAEAGAGSTAMNKSASARFGRRASHRFTVTQSSEFRPSGVVPGETAAAGAVGTLDRAASKASGVNFGRAASQALSSHNHPLGGGAGMDVAGGGAGAGTGAGLTERLLGAEASRGSLAASWPAPGGAASHQHQQHMAPPVRVMEGAKAGALLPGQHPMGTAAAGPLPMPGVDDLLTQVMADVRPWGKKAADSLLVGGPLPALGQRGGVFLNNKQERHNAGSPKS